MKISLQVSEARTISMRHRCGVSVVRELKEMLEIVQTGSHRQVANGPILTREWVLIWITEFCLYDFNFFNTTFFAREASYKSTNFSSDEKKQGMGTTSLNSGRAPVVWGRAGRT